MNESKYQLPPGQPKPQPATRQVEYVPPSADTIRRYAHAVSRQLAKNTVSTAGFTELFQGFSEFVTVLVRIQTKHMNRRETHG